MSSEVHKTATVGGGARLGRGVTVGAYAFVGDEVEIGDDTEIMPHAVVFGPTTIGRANVLHPFSVVGGTPQQKGGNQAGGGRLVIGDRNVFREHVTVHRGSHGGVTTIDHDNLIMVSAHIAHDVSLGSSVTMANAVQLAGHVIVADHVTFGGQSGVAQHVKIGESAFVAAGAMCERDVPPFVIVQGDRARARALNVVGLRRRGVPEGSIERLGVAFRRLFASRVPMAQALRHIEPGDPYVDRLVAQLSQSTG